MALDIANKKLQCSEDQVQEFVQLLLNNLNTCSLVMQDEENSDKKSQLSEELQEAKRRAEKLVAVLVAE